MESQLKTKIAQQAQIPIFANVMKDGVVTVVIDQGLISICHCENSGTRLFRTTPIDSKNNLKFVKVVHFLANMANVWIYAMNKV